MDLGRLLPLYPKQLSGGDQQKVSLARAIVRRPAVYLMDEPLGTLDADQRLAMRELIRAEQLASGVTTIYVTHDQEEAMSLADRIVVMDGGQIRQVGTPAEVYDRPADLFVASFVGSPGMNFIRGEVAAADGRGLFVSEDGAGAHRGPARGDRAGVVGARDARDPLRARARGRRAGRSSGRVVTEEYLGSARNVHVDAACGRLVMRADAASPCARGAEAAASTWIRRRSRSSTARRRRGCERRASRTNETCARRASPPRSRRRS